MPEVARPLDQSQGPLLNRHVSYINQAIVIILQYQDISQMDGTKQDAFCMQCDQVSCQLVQVVVTVADLGEAVPECGTG